MLQMENMSAREQILVVDDEPMICKSCKEILEDEGFFVDMAYSGEEGLKKGLEKKFDLVILDIRMPDISGMTLLKRMKAEQKNTPVVMITAFSTVESAVEAMKLGARDFVPKPFTPDELSQVVRSVIIKKGEADGRIPGELIIPKEMVKKALEKQKLQAQYTIAVEIDKCIGCRSCQLACPFGLISMDREGKGAQKCHLCLERVKEGIDPVCVLEAGRGSHIRGQKENGRAGLESKPGKDSDYEPLELKGGADAGGSSRSHPEKIWG
jgi:CheY-like chemotaxis protein